MVSNPSGAGTSGSQISSEEQREIGRSGIVDSSGQEAATGSEDNAPRRLMNDQPANTGQPQIVTVPTVTETVVTEITAPVTVEHPAIAAAPASEAPAAPAKNAPSGADKKQNAPLAKEAEKHTQRHEPLNIDFPGKEPNEVFRFYFRQHWVRLTPPMAKAAGWTLFLFFASATNYIGFPLDDTTRRFVLVPLTIFFVFFQMELMRRWYEYFLHIIIVTDLKIHRFKRRFLLLENERSVDIPTIRDINREQRGPFQAFMGYGSLILDTPQGELTVHFVPALSKMHDALVVQRDEKRTNGNGGGNGGTPSGEQEHLLEDVKTAVQTLKPHVE